MLDFWHKQKILDYLAIAQAEIRKGLKNEDRAEEALRILAARGDIHHFDRCKPDGEWDTHGIDFLVYPEPGWIRPLQIKSSEGGRFEHKEQGRGGQYVPCAVVNRLMVPEELADEILRELWRPIEPLEHRDEGFRNSLVQQLIRAFEKDRETSI